MIRIMFARFIKHDMPAGNQKQFLAAPEEKARGIGKRFFLLKGVNSDGSEQYGLNHNFNILTCPETGCI